MLERWYSTINIASMKGWRDRLCRRPAWMTRHLKFGRAVSRVLQSVAGRIAAAFRRQPVDHKTI